MRAVIVSVEDHDRIMKEWRSAEASVHNAIEAAERYKREHGRTSDDLTQELIEAMNKQFLIMSQLQALANR